MYNENLPSDFQNKLIDFASSCLSVCDSFSHNKADDNLQCQISKSAIACATLFAEANIIESKIDFVRKTKAILKEVLSIKMLFRIIDRNPKSVNEKIAQALEEAGEVAIIIAKYINEIQKSRTIKKIKRKELELS